MGAEQYLEQILHKYSLTEGEEQNLRGRRAQVEREIRREFGASVEAVYYSGSFAKGTATKLGSDLDLCFYFKRSAFQTLKGMYTTVFDTLLEDGFGPRKQTVSINLTMGGNQVDIVPARSLGDGTNDANLYVTTRDGLIKTNIPKQRDFLAASKARPTIKLMKIWRDRRGISFKSFALELLTIKALEGVGDAEPLGNQFQKSLVYAAEKAATARLVDPANSANVVSDLIPTTDKQNLASQARAAAAAKNWGEVVS
jgi:hypothetical protein